MTQPTGNELKALLAKMLPDRIGIVNPANPKFVWVEMQGKARIWHDAIKDTELLHICHLIEESFSIDITYVYASELRQVVAEDWNKTRPNFSFYDLSETKQIYLMIHVTWRQRTIALAKTKGLI